MQSSPCAEQPPWTDLPPPPPDATWHRRLSPPPLPPFHVQAAGLDGALSDPSLQGTLFAPTDAAFAQLLAALKLKPEELLANTELLTKVGLGLG